MHRSFILSGIETPTISVTENQFEGREVRVGFEQIEIQTLTIRARRHH